MKIFIALIAFTINLNIAFSQDTLQSVISKKNFLESCLKTANKNTPTINAPAFCNCIFDLITQNLNTSDVANVYSNVRSTKLTDTVLALIDALSNKAPNQLKLCVNSGSTSEIKPWTRNEEDVFLASCIEEMESNQTIVKNYDIQKCCQCLLDNVKGKFSDKELLESSSNPAIMEITRNCLKANKLK